MKVFALCASVILVAVALPKNTFGQEFAVYTVVHPADEPGQVLARSSTIFHAGKSYDHMAGVGELVICHPVQRRFTIIHEGRIGTRLAFDEVAQYINVGRNETQSYADELAARPDGGDVAQALKFQLLPSFDTTVTPVGFTMTAPYWNYEVISAEPQAAQQAQRYSDYADAAARLNFVLHPQSFFPAVREALNEELRRTRRVPTRVALKADVGEVVHLVAEHKYRWTLEDYDRRQIQKFDRMAESDEIQWISFREYQRRVVGQ